MVVDHLKHQHIGPEKAYAYIYCDYNERTTQTPLILLSSLLQQMLRRTDCDTLPSDVSSLYTLHKKHNTRPTLSQIKDVLRGVCLPYKSVHIVIDALDECAEMQESTLDFLEAVQALGENISLMCTSRSSAAFDAFFTKATKIEISASEEDIRMFLEARINHHPRLSRHIRADVSLKEEIITTIIEESQGMFLLAALHFESLSRKISRKEVRSSLTCLPKTLDATYEKALVRIHSQAYEDVELAETVIFWVLCARRTLTVLEIQHMYAMRDLAEDTLLEDDDLPDGDILTSVCGGLIVVDGELKSARLVHYTAQEFFQRIQQARLPSSRFDLTKICLAYLRLPNFSDGICTTDAAMSLRLAKYPFLEYAAHHWGSESANINFDVLENELEAFMSNETAVSVTSQIWSVPTHRYTHWSQEFPRNVPVLVLTASFDLPNVLRRLVTAGHDLEGKGSDGETALIRASRLGLTASILALLDVGAAVDATDSAGETALERAAAGGKAEALRALLHGGADIKFTTGANWTVLMSAVLSGSIEVVRILVEAGADVAAETTWGDSAITLALRNGHESIASYLVDSGAVLPVGLAGRRSSAIASKRGLVDLARRLTAHYTAVATRGLERQRPGLLGQLADIPESKPDSQVECRSSIDESQRLLASKIDGMAEIVDGLTYTRGFLRRYVVLERIGSGHSAEVHACKSKVTGVSYAAKVFVKTAKIDYTMLRREIEAMNDLRHENILRLVDVVVSDTMDQLFLVMDLCRTDLFNAIITREKLGESETRRLFTQLFGALGFIHERGWVHRDVKPENILLVDFGKDPSIKLADFGLARPGLRNDDLPEKMCSTLCGTPSYVAPEILADARQRRYTFPADVWSAGVVLYICLCGFPPFSDELYSEHFPYSLTQQIKGGKFDFPSPYWDSVGDPALDLIDAMIVVAPERRLTVAQCLRHPWMTMGDSTVDEAASGA